MDEKTALSLLQAARDASARAYAPYSDFPVGAALLTDQGDIVTGVNVENVSYGLTVCAERCAVLKAVSDGKKAFRAIAVWAARREHGAVTPCGACRQVLAEFFPSDAVVVMAAPEGGMRCLSIAALLPDSFELA